MSSTLIGSNGEHLHKMALGDQVAPPSNTQDVINLQYMELEEFLLENAVAVVQQQQHQDHGKGRIIG